jgi:hypothetical protein
MAEVPYTGTSQTVLPQEQIGGDYLQVQANPAETGGLISQGVEKAGQGIEAGAHFFQQVQTDQMINDTMEKGRQIVKNFQALRGADADGTAQAETQKQLNEVWKAGRANLDTPFQQQQYDQQSRMFFERFLAPQIDNHAIQQNLVYANGVVESRKDNGRSIINEAPWDNNAFTTGVGLMHDAYIKQAQLKYGQNLPKEILDQVQQQTEIDATESRILALLPSDPVMAKAIFDSPKNNKALSSAPNFDTLSAHVETAYNRQIAGPIADQKLAQIGVVNTPTGPTLTPRPIGPSQINSLIDILHNQESGGANAAPTSPAGAVGPMQIKPATFAQYSRPGENLDINNLADQRTVAGRIIEDGLRLSGGNPAGAAVAYFSGAGNVAPPGSPTPWKKDLVDPTNGLSTSQYVQQVSAKSAKAGMLIDKAAVLDQIDKDYPNNPALAQAIRSHINERFAIANQVQQSAALEQENWRNQTAANFASEIVKSTLPGQTLAPDFYSRVATALQNGLSASAGEGLYRFARQASTDAISQTAKEYGSGFLDVVRRLNLPADDPNRISNDSQLVSYLGANPDQLKPSGVTEASRFLKMAHEQPGQSLMIEQFLKTARSQIVGPEVKGYPNPEAEQKYSSWLTAALPQIYKGIDEGKPISELTKEGSPLDLDIKKLIQPLAEKINAPSAPAPIRAPGFTFDLTKHDISTPEGIANTRAGIVDAYQASSKTARDWDLAHDALTKLPQGPQAPVSK